MKMDLILERVQNKFACIIGELCSEPVVLSKFAIWLDLRLCEYKLKGAISLDCSGETPDPSWLKGHEKQPPKLTFPRTGNGQTRSTGKLSGPRLGPKMGPRSVRRPRPEPVEYEDNSSMEPADPDISMVKEEPTEHTSPTLFPVSLTKAIPNRKRSAAETIAKSLDLSEVSPAKMDRSEAGSNQSLLSLVGNSEEQNELGDSDRDFKVEIQAGLDEPATQLKDDEESIAYSSRYSTGVNLASHSPSSADDSSSAHHMASFQSSDSFNLDQTPSHQPDGCVATPGAVIPRGLDGGDANSAEYKKLACKNAASAISIFTRWLAKSGYIEIRPIEEIQAELLDNYLTHFFATVERRNGNEYQSSGLRRIRESLQYYLKNCGYPESITTAPAFAKSRKAFQKKFYELKQKEKEVLIEQYKNTYPPEPSTSATNSQLPPINTNQNLDEDQNQSKSSESKPIKATLCESGLDPGDVEPDLTCVDQEEPDQDPDDLDCDLNESGIKLQGRNKNEVDIECPVCQKSFTRKDSLKRHLRLHTEDPKPYGCQFCDLRFNRRDTMRIHQARCQLRTPAMYEGTPPKFEETPAGFVDAPIKFETPIRFEESSLP